MVDYYYPAGTYRIKRTRSEGGSRSTTVRLQQGNVCSQSTSQQAQS
jgi:hypothetical protein